MYLRSLYLYNFRLYKEAFFEFSSGMNLIMGGNARGKTTLLEAIHFFMLGRSFRTPYAKDLIKEGETAFYIEATFVKFGIEQVLKIAFDGNEKRITHNATPLHSHTDLIGLISGVIFHPDDAAVVKGAPLVRRHLLDVQIAQADPLYVHHLTRYNRAMRQRNHLLRLKQESTIESWEFEMGNSAAYLVEKRRQAVGDLGEKSAKIYRDLSGSNELLSLGYKNGAPIAHSADIRAFYLDQLKKMRKREMSLGVTLSGPHKDDLTISIDHKDARHFASEGQQRSSVAALRLAEWERLKELASISPLMSVDDIGISFDQTRKTKILEYLGKLKQVFLTTANELDLEGKRFLL